MQNVEKKVFKTSLKINFQNVALSPGRALKPIIKTNNTHINKNKKDKEDARRYRERSVELEFYQQIYSSEDPESRGWRDLAPEFYGTETIVGNNGVSALYLVLGKWCQAHESALYLVLGKLCQAHESALYLVLGKLCQAHESGQLYNSH